MESDGDQRLKPTWWNHQRHVLAVLAAQLRRVLADQRARLTGATVYDLGAGDSPYRPLFQSYHVARYVACDLNDDAEVRMASGQPTPLDAASADWVVSFQVLEHVWDLDWYLGEALRLMKPDGRLLLSTHGTWLYHPHPTDFRRWTRDGLVGEIESRGFVVEQVLPVVGPLAWTTQIRLLGWREAFRKLPLIGNLLTHAMAIVMNLRMVVEDAVTPASITATNACVYLVLARKSTDAAPSHSSPHLP